MTLPPQAVDLFCGCGGLSLGLREAGFELIAGIDAEDVFLQTYRANFPAARALNRNLEEMEPEALFDELGLNRGELDLLAGGPPCQGFSKNVPRRNRFLDDPKNRLVVAFLRFADAARPRYLMMENVAEMKNGFQQSYTNLLLDELTNIGYSVDHRVLYAPDFGVPQRRRRAFFLAARDGERITFPEPGSGPSHGCAVTVWDAIGDLPQIEHGEGTDPAAYSAEPFHSYQRWARGESGSVRNHVARRLQPLQHERLSSLGPGQSMRDLPERLQARSGYSGAYGRLSKEMLAPTITRWVFHPGSGRFGHPASARVITIREAARLQAFPDSFIFTGTYIQQSHQVGNAVPPLLAEALGRALLAG